ncbi:hypothetical protein BJ508DRAFT_357041 [Ascobolus immersus RN42]|uniref:Uncharacterized protein n=1 Tax=Ascobolus immersus RN42 TaxID=1160509 RepID=A0A3N4IRH0_ASCIM|nr:hypothetical protein BJ508DRAFT_357041 [Ascobolus immersus RN42]
MTEFPEHSQFLKEISFESSQAEEDWNFFIERESAFNYGRTQPYAHNTADPANDLKWPVKPKRLRRDIWGIIIDVFRLLISLAFLAFGVATDRIDGRIVDESSNLRLIKDTSLLLPTVFPIAFTALTGKTLRDIALALAVRGSRLLDIEQLTQYNSVGASVVTFFKFRTINILALTLLVVWAFSPLGGQGGLRMIETYNSTSSHQDGTFAYYVRPNATTIYSDRPYNYFRGDVEFYGAQIDNLFTPSLVSSLGPQGERLERDNFGHVRIPRLSSLQAAPEDGGWIKVDRSRSFRSKEGQNPRSIQYSSFLGVPIRILGAGSAKQGSFSIETSYLEFECFEKKHLKTTDEDLISGMHATQLQSLFNMSASTSQPFYNLTDLANGKARRKEHLVVVVVVIYIHLS